MPGAEFDIITIADMCVDLAVDLGDVAPRFGQVEQWVPDYFLELGGSANIFACQAARLGLRVAVLGRVGDDAFGRLALQRLAACGVDTRFVIVDRELKTGLGLILCRPSGDRAILTYGGSLAATRPEDVTDAFLRAGRHLHYCSYYLQTGLLPVAPALLARARALGLTVSLDTNWDPAGGWAGGIHAALRQADLFFPNDQEALAIGGAPELPAAVAALAAQGPTVVVKCGPEGALIAAGADRLAVPVEPVAAVVDTIGAGDSFDAGFVAGWLEGRPLRECAELGNRCGRATTLARGGLLGQLTAPHRPHVPGASQAPGT